MSNLTPTIQGYYPLHTFLNIRDLWRQMAVKILQQNGGSNKGGVRSIDNDSLISLQGDEAVDVDTLAAIIQQLPQFCLLQSPRFQALLTGKLVDIDGTQQVAIEIAFSSVEIDLFMQPLIPYLSSKFGSIVEPDFTNDSELQSEFTRLLLAAIAGTSDRSTIVRERQLQQQVAQSNLLNYIITQIHQTLDLPSILQATVEQVQTFLHADRLIIYQFEFATAGDESNRRKSFANYRGLGTVAHESIDGNNIQSVLNISEHQDCFDNRELWDKYREGMTRSIDRVELEYAGNRCMLDLMERSQIQSKLVVPIVINTELWGLLIAHQCHAPRQWQLRETEFLQQVAQHLALAIDRSELYATTIDRSHDLEQRVNKRTRELRDAVIVAQTANQSKTEFLALLSHELRTPLTSILGLSSTLLRLPSLNLTDRQQNYLQIIHNSGEHLSELIDDILDFYKLEVGKTFLKISEFSLIKLIEQVVEIVRSKAEHRQIDVEIQIIRNPDDLQPNNQELRFRGDIKRVRQILLNILTNAIKFTPERGTIVVRAWMEDCYAVLEVEDSGIGIEEDQIPHLFKKFQQLDRTFERDYGGMGLGLAITQQLVELHGGSIEVDSIVGSGSTFTVRLASQPLKLAEQRNDWQEMDRTLAFQDPELNPIPNRVILIEQDEDLANFICDVLTAARYQVTWFLSAESSFRQISMFNPNLLIIDLAPDPETVERAIANIRKSSTISNLKILAISTPEDLIDPTSQQAADDYLWKPINPEQLLRKMTKLLSSSEP